MSAREIVTKAIPCNIIYGREQAADDILKALTAAGYRILAPGQPDDFTREQAAKIAERQAGLVPPNTKAFKAYRDGAQHSANAIRAMGEKL